MFANLFSEQGGFFPAGPPGAGNQQYYYFGGHPGPHEQQGSSSSSTSRPRGEGYVPPAAPRIINSLPEVVITKRDLFLDNGMNAECCICMEEQKLSDLGTKMPCGHIFCKECTEFIFKFPSFFSTCDSSPH